MNAFLTEVEIPCQQLQKYAYRIKNGYGVSEKDTDWKSLVHHPGAAKHLEKVVEQVRNALHDRASLLEYLYHRNAFTVEFTKGEKIFAEMKSVHENNLSSPEYVFKYLIQVDAILEKYLDQISKS